jgi:hypothetical protein
MKKLHLLAVLLLLADLSCGVGSSRAEVLAEYLFENGTSDSSGRGLNAELVGDASIVDGRLFLPGGLDNALSIPLGDFSPFDGATNWSIAFEFQTVEESTGALFSSDGSAEEEPWPDNPDTGDQTGSLNVFLNEQGQVATDFWFIDAVASNEAYNDDEVHTFQGSYDADFGEFVMVIDDDDEAIGTFVFERDATIDRTFVGDESNGDFGAEFNPAGFHGFFDNIVIESEGALPPIMGDVLQAGDANQDFQFDQLDLVQVQVAARYLTGQAATWGEGDWDGAPGGAPGNPPTGNGLFDQLDIIAALDAGTYLTGPYNAIRPDGISGDAQTSVVYNPATGEVGVDAPTGTELTSINIDSAAGIFTAEAAQNLGGSFDNDADNNIFKATFGGSFGSLSFGHIAQAGLSQEMLINDLTVVGSLAGGGALGDVDLIYVPEPSTVGLFMLAVTLWGLYATRGRQGM